jgi:hypothetical protein
VKTAKKAALGVLAASVLVLGLPMTAANADTADTVHGGCFFNTDSQQTVTQDQNQGVIGVDAVMTTPAGTPDTGAEIDCKIQVNLADAPGTEIDVKANPAGVISGQQQIIFDDQGGTLPSALCENDIDGNGGSTGWVCTPSTEIQIPPQAVLDLLNTLINTAVDAVNGVLADLDPVFAAINPIICPVLAQLAPGVPGVLDIAPDGSFVLTDPLGDTLTYDCS